jgi:FkbM family methyltransferase
MRTIAGKAVGPEVVETNCGVSDDLRVLIPADKHSLVYGRPDHELGERATIALAEILARQSGAFLDVGANEGLFAFVIGKALGPARYGDIHVFEPDPVVFERLSGNLRRNSIGAQVNRVAAGARSGAARFYRHLGNDLAGSMNCDCLPAAEREAIETTMTSLADYLTVHEVAHACLKVDVEGFGAEVWEGLRPAVDRVDWLIMEMIAPEWAANLPARIPAESGWRAYYIRDFELREWRADKPTAPGKSSYDYLDPCYNWLFCARSPQEMAALLAGSRFRVLTTAEWG